MTNLDTIIIGSGAGGLSAAINLARAGQKVCVIEQHYVPGGWCHSFYLNGQRFNPGVHYIGLMDKGESTAILYESLGIANDLVFFRMNPAGYEHCWIGDERIDLPAGVEKLIDALSQRFPHEKKGLTKYLRLVEKVGNQIQLIPKMSGLWDNLTIAFRTAQLGQYGLFSLKTVIDWHIKDPLLKKVLSVQCGDHGLPPSKISFAFHAALMGHYMNGGFYPMGGGAAIVKAMTNEIKKLGGEIKTGNAVKRILLDGNKRKRAIGVELITGEKFFANTIVSNADPEKTYLNLVGEENLSSHLRAKLSKTKYSVTSLMLFLTVDMDIKSYMDSGNIWMLRNLDFEKLYEEIIAKDILTDDEFPAIFIGSSTLKDPTSFNGRYHNIEVITFLDYDAFDQYKNTGDEKQAYSKYKKRIIKKILNSLEKVIPQISNHIIQMELGTPKTNEFYVNATRGNVYGTEKKLLQIGPFSYSNKSEIKNLYLCGASILSHGIAGASNSGVQTAARILGRRMDELLKPIEGQNLRIYNADDNTQWPDAINQRVKEKKRLFKEIPSAAL